MARTGNFGRSTRTATSLTNTVIAIAREFQQQRGQNIMDAWQKGGTFEGKKATDKLVLQFWRDKAGGVSKDDPLYDTYKNTVTQLDYGIHESKMTAQYALGKATDQQMTAFYLGWSKKVPKDSEFYRVLQRDAGQYMRSAKAGSEARAAKAKELAYQNAQSGTQAHYEAGAEFIMDTLRRVSQSYGLIAPGSSGYGANDTSQTGEDFTDFDAGGINPDTGKPVPSDAESILKLLQVIDPQAETGHDIESAKLVAQGQAGHNVPGSKDVIFHADDKSPVTGADIIAKLHKLDPTFKPGTPLDVAHITGLLDRQSQGLQERINRANKTGHPQDAANLTKSLSYVSMLNRQVAAWPVEKAYSSLRETYDAVANDPTASPKAVKKAWETYSAALIGLSKDPTIAADDNLRNRITAEANGEAGMPTLHESFTGMNGGSYDVNSAKDSANTAAHMEFIQEQIDSVEKGAGLLDGDPNKVVWTYGKTTNGIFTPDPTGREIGAANAADIDAAGAPGSGTYITVPDPKSGGSITMRVTGTPIKAVATGPDGQPLSASSPNPIAFAYTLPNGDTTSLQYGFKGPDGSLVLSKKPPFSDDLPMTPSKNGGNHFEIDLGSMLTGAYGAVPGDPTSFSLDPSKIDLYTQGGVPGLTGWSVEGNGPPTAANPKGTPGQLVFNPYIAATSTDDRPPGGLDVTSDFHSLTLSTLMASPEGLTVLQNLDTNPAFKTQLTNDANAYAGVARDEKGAWMPGTGDQSKLGIAMAQVTNAGASKDIEDWVTNQFKTWQRGSTEPYHPGSPGSTVPGPDGMAAPAGFDLPKLATTLLKGTAFEPVAGVLFPGTLTPKPPPDVNAQTGFTVNVGQAMKTPDILPAIAAVGAVAGQMAGATSAQGKPPAQTGSQAPTPIGPNPDHTYAQPNIYTGWGGGGGGAKAL